MKTRKVMLMIEVETDMPISEMRSKDNYILQLLQEPFGINDWIELNILQIQVNVVKEKK